MRKLVILLVLGLVASPLLSSANTHFETRAENINDIDFLVIISDDCGWSYFIVNETLHEMGVNVTTLTNTESYIVTSCPNREPRPITADILLSEFDLETIDEYDGIVIPAGGQWRYHENDTDLHELLRVAYDGGLVIGSICNGGILMVRSEVLTNGTNVVTLFPRVAQQLNELGAVMVWNARVVSDRRIVTGDYGAFEIAPIYEVCLEMVKTVMEYSHVANTEVTLVDGMQYQITVEVANISQDLPEFNVTNVEEVVANIYPESNPSDIIEVELTQLQDTNQYIGNFTILDSEKHVVDLDIMSEEDVLEVVRTATTFLDETGIPIDTLLLLGGGVGVGAIVVVVLFLRKKS
ncbi:MAG: DJ-1/PfpI family protein [Candidatus Thorarchaeota archaeon]